MPRKELYTTFGIVTTLTQGRVEKNTNPVLSLGGTFSPLDWNPYFNVTQLKRTEIQWHDI
jgi:hypothetical protein